MKHKTATDNKRNTICLLKRKNALFLNLNEVFLVARFLDFLAGLRFAAVLFCIFFIATNVVLK
jgi:hypothetical protein